MAIEQDWESVVGMRSVARYGADALNPLSEIHDLKSSGLRRKMEARGGTFRWKP